MYKRQSPGCQVCQCQRVFYVISQEISAVMTIFRFPIFRYLSDNFVKTEAMFWFYFLLSYLTFYLDFYDTVQILQ